MAAIAAPARQVVRRRRRFCGANSILRSLVGTYALAEVDEKFLSDFVAARVKVMNADRSTAFDRRVTLPAADATYS
jgi:catalase (peroxidase I)